MDLKANFVFKLHLNLLYMCSIFYLMIRMYFEERDEVIILQICRQSRLATKREYGIELQKPQNELSTFNILDYLEI